MAELEARFPSGSVQSELTPGRKGSFEITLNDQLIHSKLGGEGFPDPNRIAQLVAAGLG
jgi:selT/selW/selH-like putative selenoprotein